MAAIDFAGVILAGGASRRMGRDKALVTVGGTPLAARALARLAPQVGTLAIAAHEPRADLEILGPTLLIDAPGARRGPIAGLLAGLAFARAEGRSALAIAPCDAPFLPLDLVERLNAGRAPDEIAVASGPLGPEPLFSLWPTSVEPRLRAAAGRGEFSPLRFIEAHGARRATFDGGEPYPFFNVNSPQDLESARRWIAAESPAPEAAKRR